MSSRDIGPALPPHMRRNHSDVGSGTEERKRDSEDERRRKYRDKHSDRDRHRERDRDRDRVRARRDDYRDWNRSSRHSDRNRDRGRERREVVSKSQEIGKQEQSSSSKRSKRSKTDRTYNTDTEESSDDSSNEAPKLAPVKDVHSSDSEVEDSQGEDEISTQHSVQESDEVCSAVDVNSLSGPVGPALPPHLVSKVSTRKATLDDCSNINFSSSSEVGPELPPHLKSKVNSEEKDTVNSIGPTLPPHLKTETMTEENDESVDVLGPALPLHLEHKVDIDKEDSDSNNLLGPALPQHLIKAQPSKIGPSIPAHLMKQQSSGHDSEDESAVIGPALPPGLRGLSAAGPSLPLEHSSGHPEESSDDEVVGPLLPEEMIRSGKNFVVQAQLERNAAAIKRKLEEKDLPDTGEPRREEWMLELPPESTVDLGLGPRTFRAKGAPVKGADRSEWTDTPADKARKEEEAKRRFELGISTTDEVKKVAKSKELSGRDKSMETIVKKHKRSKESLLDSHQKKLKKDKKKKEESTGKQERRPFDREVDLKTNVFDDAQKKAIYKKAQFLDSRFSSGESKYL